MPRSTTPLLVWALGGGGGHSPPELREALSAVQIELRSTPEGCPIALLDARNPEALDVLGLLRAEPATRDLLVTAIVPAGNVELLEALAVGGVDGVVFADRLVEELALRIRLLLRRQQEREAAQRHERDLAAILELTSDYAHERDAEALLHKVVRRVADELGVPRVALLLFDEDPATGQVVASSDAPSLSPTRLQLADYPELEAMRSTKQPVVVEDAPHHPLLERVRDRIEGKDIGAIAAVPLLVQDRVLGAMLVRAPAGRHRFSTRDIALASTVSHATAVALRTARRLARAEARVADLAGYESFFEAFAHGLAIVGSDGSLFRINPKGLELLGVEPGGQGLGKVLRGMPSGSEEAIQELIFRARDGQPRTEVDIPMRRQDGDSILLAISATPLGESAGKELARAVVLCFRDVTSARATQGELRKTKELLERLIDQAADAIIAADMKGRVIVFNRGAERLFGWKAEEAVGKLHVSAFYPPGLALELMGRIRAGSEGGSGRLAPTRIEVISRGGERVPVSMTAAVVTEDEPTGKREVATVGTYSDLRERMNLEARLERTEALLAESEKQALVAALAGTAAHELNQPLTSIMGYAELLRRRIRTDDPASRHVDVIYRESERMADIVRKIGRITRFETKAYVGQSRIVDLERSVAPEEEAS